MNTVIVFHGLLAALIGLLFGSFLSTVITRFGNGASWVRGRSACPYCGQVIKSRSLVPVFSFIIQRGKCLDCRSSISVFYPLLEIATAVLFFGLYWRFHTEIAGVSEMIFYVLYGLFILGSVVIFEVDRRQGIIPNMVTYPLVAVFLVAVAAQYLLMLTDRGSVYFFPYEVMPEYIFGGLLSGSALFFLFVLISRETWMGWGDVKYGVVLGLYLGYLLAIVAVMAAFILGGIYSAYLLITKKAQLKGSVIFFGPFLVIGSMIALFFGQYIVQWYLY